MYLIHLSTIKQLGGYHEIEILIPNKSGSKKYTYLVPSEFIANKFLNLYRRGERFHDKALTLLNKHKIPI
jgi:hypothetical protein